MRRGDGSTGRARWRAFKILALVVLAFAALGGVALAAFPQSPPNDPEYAPAEAGGVSCATTSADAEQHYLYSFIPKCATNASDPTGAAGMSLDEAWRKYTPGNPHTVIAYIEGGINWQNEPRELANKVFLNRGELPPPTTRVKDGVLNAKDYGDTKDTNGNGIVDPEDIIARFSDGRDDDHNGYTDDISGWDFYENQNDPATVDTSYTHPNSQMRQAAAETNNGVGEAGVCPKCMVLPIKAGAEALDRTDDLAQAWNYAADMNVDVLVSVTADLGYSSFMRQTVERVWRKGVIPVESSNDFDSTDHQGAMFWPHVLPGNGMVANDAGLQTAPGSAAAQNQLLDNFRSRSGFTSWGTHNMFTVATEGGTTSESSPTIGGVMAMVVAWGKEAAKKGLIKRPLTNDEAVQVVRDTASDVSGDTNWPSKPGWDLQFGYGRPEVPAAMAEIAKNAIPPVAWFEGPRWYSLYDPTERKSVPVKAHIDAPRTPGRFRWRLEYGLGPEPAKNEFHTIARGSSEKPVDGRIGKLSLAKIPKSFWNAPFHLSRHKQLETSEQYTVTLRVQVTDKHGRTGEERRSIAVHHDPDLLPGFPHRIASSGEAQPKLVDLQGRGDLAMVFGDADGYVHAIDPKSGSELPGWPVHSKPTKVTKAHRGVDPGHEPFINSVAVADLTGRGHLSVVATSTTGRVYAWNRMGRPLPGWPKALGKGVRKPAVPRPDLPYTRQPVLGATAPPVLADVDGDRRLDVIQVGWNGRLYVWNARGHAVHGFPVKVKLPADHSPPPGYVTEDDQKLDTAPAVGDIDGDGKPEIVLKSQYTDALGTGLQPLPTSHLHAYNSDGSPVAGFPVEVRGLISDVGTAQEFITEGANSPSLADVDGDGKDEIAFEPALFSPAQLIGGDGSTRSVYGPVPGATLSLLAGNNLGDLLDVLDGNLPDDTPVGFTTSGAFGRVGGGRLAYAEPGSGAASVASALLLAGGGFPINNYVRAFDAQSGAPVAGFPAKVQGLDFLGAPAIADIDGDGEPDVINAADSSAIGGYGSQGKQVGGFPHFQPGWIVWSPSVGDVDSNGTNDVVAMTREGYLMAWRTQGKAGSGDDEWWSFRHDERNTGTYGTDTRPPGAVRHAKVVGGRSRHPRLRFRVPGDDWYAGRAKTYRVWFVDRHNKRIRSGPARRRVGVDAGGTITVQLPARTRKVKVRVFDEAGNGSPRIRRFVRR